MLDRNLGVAVMIDGRCEDTVGSDKEREAKSKGGFLLHI